MSEFRCRIIKAGPFGGDACLYQRHPKEDRNPAEHFVILGFGYDQDNGHAWQVPLVGLNEFLKKVSVWSRGQSALSLPRLSSQKWPAAIYAIGDVHGCHAQLIALEAKIVADAADIPGEKWLVMLGDYVDRGPNSAGVIDRLLSSDPPGFRRICLAGNHEIMMLNFINDARPDSQWLRWGGVETLASYGLSATVTDGMSPPAIRKLMASHIPADHLAFLRQRPACLSVPGVTFVHAGLRPGVALDDQCAEDMLWIREPFLSTPGAADNLIVHGHTPAEQPQVKPWRIGIDTGAYLGGNLTSVRLTEFGPPHFISAEQ